MKERRLRFGLLQWILWVVIYLLLLVYNIRSRDTVVIGLASSTINLGVGLIGVYLQNRFLIPRFFDSQHPGRYLAATLFAIVNVVIVRMTVDYLLLNRWIGLHHFYNLSTSHFAFAFLTVFLCFMIGFLLHTTLDYFNVLQQQQQMKHQQSEMELKLLKAQIQPHFMFNTLNNIYSLAHRRSEKTADMVARLSGIMRYVVHEAGKDLVPMTSEIAFIENYIELERIRMLRPVNIDLKVDLHTKIQVPPLLFIPFVENLFKHGIDKTKSGASAEISFQEVDGELHFRMINAYTSRPHSESGVGLQNLSRRLDILYRGTSRLLIEDSGSEFRVSLTIPLK
jgi:hypothetical protein